MSGACDLSRRAARLLNRGIRGGFATTSARMFCKKPLVPRYARVRRTSGLIRIEALASALDETLLVLACFVTFGQRDSNGCIAESTGWSQSRRHSRGSKKAIRYWASRRAGDAISMAPLPFQFRISTGLNNEKKAKVQSVAEAIERTADQAGDIADDDISSWLLGPATPSTAMKETQAMQFDETNVLDSSVMKEEADAQAEATSTGSDVLSDDEEEQGEEADESSKSKKKGPGKLPFRPEKPQAKDSVEAAQMALRNWSRRR